MMKKVLTYLTILAVTALPVQVISASVKNADMHMSMLQAGTPDCMQHDSTKGTVVENSCCEDISHQCDNCGSCPQISSAMILDIFPLAKNIQPVSHQNFSLYVALDSAPQNNLIRPPISQS